MVCVSRMPPPTSANSKCDGTVVQQVGFERPRHRLSEVVDFDISWRRNLTFRTVGGKQQNVTSTKRKGPTFFIPYGDDGASSDPHALRVDHRRAQESCNGAIYCRTPLLEHFPGEKKWTQFHHRN